MKTGIIPGLLIIIAIVRSIVLNARLIINKKFVGNIINEGILNIGNEDIQHVVFEQYLSLTTLKHSFANRTLQAPCFLTGEKMCSNLISLKYINYLELSLVISCYSKSFLFQYVLVTYFFFVFSYKALDLFLDFPTCFFGNVYAILIVYVY